MNGSIRLALLAMAVATAPAGAQTRLDSLTARLGVVDGHERVGTLIELMRAQQSDPKALAHGQEALSILRRIPQPELQADVLYFMAAAFQNGAQPDSAMAYAVAARDLAARVAVSHLRERRPAEDIQHRLGQAERYIGNIDHAQGRYADAEAAFGRALHVFERTGNRRRIADVTNDLATLYKTQGDFQKAVAMHRQALEWFEDLGLEGDVAYVLMGLGVVYSPMGRYDDALDAFFRVLEVRERLGERDAAATTLINIGGTYGYLDDHAQSLVYYEQARTIYESLGRSRSLGTVLVNMGSAYLELNRLEDARASFDEARVLATEWRNDRLLAYLDEATGRLHERLGDETQARLAYERALATFETLGDRRGLTLTLMATARLRGGVEGAAMTRRAIELAGSMDSHLLLRDGYRQLSELYADLGQFAEALEAHRLYKAAHDSLFNAESHTTIARLETEYRTKEQLQQIALLEQQRRAERLWLLGLLSSLGLLGVVTGLSVNRSRLRKNALRAQRQAHAAEAEQARLLTEAAESRALLLQAENERKSQELEAARQLQLSMLPKSLPVHPHAELEAFMRTATEVGGDYYDFHLADDGTLTVAIGDATGHGTRAGTLVAAVKSLFNSYSEDADLAVALGSWARALRRMALPNLYMAFALVRLRGRELELAGAGMPPAVIYRTASASVERVLLNGLPLGAPADAPYHTRRLTLHPGDTVVLMTDGWPELRDGTGSEFGYERVAEVISDAAGRDVDEVKQHLVDTIQAWSSDTPIRDDITFVILKIRGAN
jgi:serine phosphatase RsbU (regulator of sigma subunit)